MGVKHTEAPWEVNEYGDHREIQQVDPDGISIAIMSAGSREDAFLIAAAPELIFACRAALIAWGDKVMVTGYEHDALKLLRDAIAKAEGGDS